MNKKTSRQLMMLPIALLSILMLCSIRTAAQDQTNGQTQKENTAKTVQQTPSADQSDLDECSQMLIQSTLEARACKDLASSRLRQIQARDDLLETDQKLIDKLYKIIEVSDKLISRLEKQCSSTSFLFGLIKIKRC